MAALWVVSMQAKRATPLTGVQKWPSAPIELVAISGGGGGGGCDLLPACRKWTKIASTTTNVVLPLSLVLFFVFLFSVCMCMCVSIGGLKRKRKKKKKKKQLRVYVTDDCAMRARAPARRKLIASFRAKFVGNLARPRCPDR